MEYAPLAADCAMSGPNNLMIQLINDPLFILENTCAIKLTFSKDENLVLYHLGGLCITK